MPTSALVEVASRDDQARVATTITDRLSQELVIGLVGPVGSGVSTTAQYIADILRNDYGYTVPEVIKPSDIIKREAHRVGLAGVAPVPLSEYITQMQTAGNKLRERFGNNYLAEKTVEQIVAFRKDDGGYAHAGHQLPHRRAFVIDSIKNKEELDLFRQIYGDTFCVFGIFAPDAIRKTRLTDNGVPEADVQTIIERDQGELLTFGQMTRKVFVESDFFICNDQKKEELRRRIARYLGIIFDTNIHTPTRAESAMYEASAAASNSACMSRQVGAAIISAEGELIGVGWNDVPKFGGSLYIEDDQSVWDALRESVQDHDHRCFKWKTRVCHNETRRNTILDKIAAIISESGILNADVTQQKVRELLVGTEVDSLTEFSRSIHAEMEAMLSVAREGKHSLRGATLYTTTYPCHNCARHIVAAGISSVVYIQPYQKSLATALHSDAITEDPTVKNHVVFRQYDGVAPKNYLRPSTYRLTT